MSETYFVFYKRKIERKKDPKEKALEMVVDAYDKGRLTERELIDLKVLIEEIYG